MPSNDDYEKPKKSWRERDKGRDRSRHTNTAADRERENFQKTTAYTRYKQSLERVFSGGGMSGALREKLNPEGEGKDKDKEEKLKAMRQAEAPAAFVQAVDTYLAGYELPDDAFLLDRALEHPKIEVQLLALARLQAMRDEGRLAKPPASLKIRLDSLSLTSDESEVQEAASRLRKKL
jgi:hypothetical protein